MAKKKSPSLAIGRGEKLPVSKGAGLTAKGRACELCGITVSYTHLTLPTNREV